MPCSPPALAPFHGHLRRQTCTNCERSYVGCGDFCFGGGKWSKLKVVRVCRSHPSICANCIQKSCGWSCGPFPGLAIDYQSLCRDEHRRQHDYRSEIANLFKQGKARAAAKKKEAAAAKYSQRLITDYYLSVGQSQ